MKNTHILIYKSRTSRCLKLNWYMVDKKIKVHAKREKKKWHCQNLIAPIFYRHTQEHSQQKNRSNTSLPTHPLQIPPLGAYGWKIMLIRIRKEQFKVRQWRKVPVSFLLPGNDVSTWWLVTPTWLLWVYDKVTGKCNKSVIPHSFITLYCIQVYIYLPGLTQQQATIHETCQRTLRYILWVESVLILITFLTIMWSQVKINSVVWKKKFTFVHVCTSCNWWSLTKLMVLK